MNKAIETNNNDNVLLSVIVPIYNVGEFLERCLKSIQNQTYRNLEVLLIDDGSTDESAKIAKTFLHDNRFRYYYKSNGGLSDARNFGLTKSNGEYLLFVDSDDFLDVNMIYSLLSNLKKTNSDISVCGSYKYYNEKKIIKNQINENFVCLTSEKAISYLYDCDHYGVGVWNKLFSKKLFNGIDFPLHKVSEDYFVMYKVFANAKVICYDSTPLYYYRQRDNSITKAKKTSFDVIQAHLEFLDFANKLQNEFLLRCAFHACFFAYIGVYDTILKNKDAKNRLSEIRKKAMIYYQVAYSYEKNTQRKLQMVLFKFFPHLYGWLLILYLKRRDKSILKGE